MIRFWPVLFLIVPIAEVYLLIEVGGLIGAGWTILLVVLTAIVGVKLLKQQGISTLMRANRAMSQGQLPALEMMEGLFLAVGGALLITPGFFTDTIGFICLVPFTRRAIIQHLLLNSTFTASYSVQQENQSHEAQERENRGSKSGRTIEGEYHRED
ncbi:FxsA protein [hydrothermal vent metagenome]|uniref:FxsA protein n=1 Tax=hydrothermal vent metagenome TaxID=652676 RepID=A0A3B0X4T4_9ZZZZ